jgi:pimeloyl-ACP methyl ester carboxylesterase
VGSSHTPGAVSVERQAADCRALLRHLGVERAHVVGHSYGGVISLQLTLDTPNVVHSLALLEPALMVGATAQSYRDALTQGQQRFREGSPTVIVDEFLQVRFGAGYRAALEQVPPGFGLTVKIPGQSWAICRSDSFHSSRAGFVVTRLAPYTLTR